MTPTLVLVHGAWHGSWCWELLVEELAGDDLRVRAVDLPSAGPALGDLDDDIATVRAAIDAADGPVVVVAHSYGGVPASGAVAGAADAAGLARAPLVRRAARRLSRSRHLPRGLRAARGLP